MPQITLAHNPDRKWKLDLKAVEAACVMLGITKPVYITTCGNSNNFAGDYCGFRRRVNGKYLTEQSHIIRIRPRSIPTNATRTLWHELAHAMQCEVYFNCDNQKWDAAYDEEGGRKFAQSAKQSKLYQANKFEVEAREHEKYATKFPLCVPKRKYAKRTGEQSVNMTPKRIAVMKHLASFGGRDIRLDQADAVSAKGLVSLGLVFQKHHQECDNWTGRDKMVCYWSITDAGEQWLEENGH